MKHKSLKQSSYYSISEKEVKRKNKTCPKCGDGYFLSNHSNRFFCGNCHYTEFKNAK